MNDPAICERIPVPPGSAVTGVAESVSAGCHVGHGHEERHIAGGGVVDGRAVQLAHLYCCGCHFGSHRFRLLKAITSNRLAPGR